MMHPIPIHKHRHINLSNLLTTMWTNQNTTRPFSWPISNVSTHNTARPAVSSNAVLCRRSDSSDCSPCRCTIVVWRCDWLWYEMISDGGSCYRDWGQVEPGEVRSKDSLFSVPRSWIATDGIELHYLGLMLHENINWKNHQIFGYYDTTFFPRRSPRLVSLAVRLHSPTACALHPPLRRIPRRSTICNHPRSPQVSQKLPSTPSSIDEQASSPV